MTATNKNKEGKLSSNIVFTMPPATQVSVPRQDVMNIVTEFGIAYIYNQPISERAKRLIAIGHPDFREELTRQAIESIKYCQADEKKAKLGFKLRFSKDACTF